MSFVHNFEDGLPRPLRGRPKASSTRMPEQAYHLVAGMGTKATYDGCSSDADVAPASGLSKISTMVRRGRNGLGTEAGGEAQAASVEACALFGSPEPIGRYPTFSLAPNIMEVA